MKKPKKGKTEKPKKKSPSPPPTSSGGSTPLKSPQQAQRSPTPPKPAPRSPQKAAPPPSSQAPVIDIGQITTVEASGRVSCPTDQWIQLMNFVQ